MSSPVPDLSPEPSEVLGEDVKAQSIEPVPVVIEGPVEIRRMGNRRGVIRSFALLENGEPQRILGEDPRFARAQLLARGGLVRLASSRIAFEHGDYFELQNLAYTVTIEHIGEVWAWTASATTSVHMVAEYWTD